MANDLSSERTRPTIIIVGGGIAGLYCARLLAKAGTGSVTVYELRNELGGRIQTGDLRGFVGVGSSVTRPVFKAEFGPMRFEVPAPQRLFKQLCDDLGIHFADFTAPSSPRWPDEYSLQYSLPPDECGDDGRPLVPLELLRLGVFKMFGKKTQKVRRESGEYGIDLKDGDDATWLSGLQDDSPDGFDYLRANSKSVRSKQGLRDMTFGDALLEVLSRDAVDCITTQGTFYHLIPQAPNAVEWAIFWLRLFQHGELKTIPSGVRTITERLQAELETAWKHSVSLKLNHRVDSISVSPSDRSRLRVEVTNLSEGREIDRTVDHVILALPKAPLVGLHMDLPRAIDRNLDSVFGFTLLKVFMSSRPPIWWPKGGKPAPQDRTWMMPTREVHYFLKGANAITLLYMDEPNSQHWAKFVREANDHDAPEYGQDPELLKELIGYVLNQQREVADSYIPKIGPLESRVDARDPAARVLLRLLETLERFGVRLPDRADWQSSGYLRLPKLARELLKGTPDLMKPSDVSDYAIRDWSAMPFGAGCHAWAPGANSRTIRQQLAAFSLKTGSRKNLHICGEAYSDYQGFIEGALRSARDALTTIGPQATEATAVFRHLA